MVTVGERTGRSGTPVRRRPPRFSSVQLKFVMAVTGAILVLYLVAHMLGNLKIFFGEQALNTYAAWLREIGEPALPGEGMLWLIMEGQGSAQCRGPAKWIEGIRTVT